MLLGIASLRPQVGKSTCADHLVKEHGFVITEMSDAVIYISKKYFGFNGNKLDPSQRLILQKIGKAGKEIDPTLWIYASLWLAGRMNQRISDMRVKPGYNVNLEELNKELALKDLSFEVISRFRERVTIDGFSRLYHGGYPQNIIISGVRSPNEADEILNLGGEVWLIKNPRIEDIQGEVHAVESELSGYTKFSKTIYNDGSFNDFYSKIDDVIGNIIQK